MLAEVSFLWQSFRAIVLRCILTIDVTVSGVVLSRTTCPCSDISCKRSVHIHAIVRSCRRPLRVIAELHSFVSVNTRKICMENLASLGRLCNSELQLLQ